MSRPESEQEFDRFYESVRLPLIGQVYLLIGDLQEAEDLVQEALVRAWRQWDQVARLDDPQGWTRRVVHNLAISHLRYRKVRLRQVVRRIETSPEPTALDADLLSGLRRLPLNQRRALVLTAIGGLSTAEVAEEMKAKEGTVRVWLSRGRAQLATTLDVTPIRPEESDVRPR
jgi:RNA polymerase sigma-70 factor, ECF subfamily